MMHPALEIIAVLSLSVSVPTLMMAMWHGWKIELHRSERDTASVDEGSPPWN